MDQRRLHLGGKSEEWHPSYVLAAGMLPQRKHATSVARIAFARSNSRRKRCAKRYMHCRERGLVGKQAGSDRLVASRKTDSLPEELVPSCGARASLFVDDGLRRLRFAHRGVRNWDLVL